MRVYTSTTRIEDVDIEVLVMLNGDDEPHIATRLQHDTRWSAPLDLEEQS